MTSRFMDNIFMEQKERPTAVLWSAGIAAIVPDEPKHFVTRVDSALIGEGGRLTTEIFWPGPLPLSLCR